ncbi:hypothetical protein EVAR_71418_1 [Eumeta japonica]|uniref:Chromo domain-containing protein n=1 Tax=Eumeta variegata TaxID=151549 RepID=A0A4C1SIJ4_EUMVA|nr:hypothetical protein EVAR_71418_1 [Eumeta japonica]
MGLLLWKATQISNNKDNNVTSPNSWALYQTWVKMEETLRETWIVAGRTIQSFAKVSQDSENEASPIKSPLVGNNMQKVVKKPISTPQLPTNKPLTTTPANTTAKPLTRRAKRSIPNSEDVVEENVEKIVAKRFNPRRRMHEYLVKWENRSLEQNTWEPASHLEDVPHLWKHLKNNWPAKETRAAMQAKQQAAAAAASANASKPLEVNKLWKLAMDQVKQWVSGTNSSDANSPSSELTQHQENEKDWSMNSITASNRPVGAIKRKLDDADYNDSTASDIPPATTTNTMEDFEENLIPLNTLKKMKYGNAVSVEVKTKLDNNKEIKVNGTVTGRRGCSNSAEVIITQDSNASGVVKKPGFNGSNMNQNLKLKYEFCRGESAVSNSVSYDWAQCPASVQRTAIQSRNPNITIVRTHDYTRHGSSGMASNNQRVVQQTQRHSKHQLQQRQRQQSQVHIQKVQQLTGPAQRGSTTITQRKPQQHVQHQIIQQQEEEPPHQAQLCPITGNIIGQEDQQQQQQQIQNPNGQTILVTQADGEQQFAYVAAAEGENENQVLTLDNAVAEAVAQLPVEQQAEALAAAAAMAVAVSI